MATRPRTRRNSTGRFIRTPQNTPTKRFQRTTKAKAGMAGIAAVAGLALTSRFGRRRDDPPQRF